MQLWLGAMLQFGTLHTPPCCSQVVAHMGPTNSGKTHAALQALKAAETGVYCGPLRLLAWEVCPLTSLIPPVLTDRWDA